MKLLKIKNFKVLVYIILIEKIKVNFKWEDKLNITQISKYYESFVVNFTSEVFAANMSKYSNTSNTRM